MILEYGIQYKAERGHDGRKIRLVFVGKNNRHGKEKHGKKITGADTKRFITGIVPVPSVGNEEYLPEIEKALMEKLAKYGKTSVIYNIQKQHQPRKNGKRQDKSI